MLIPHRERWKTWTATLWLLSGVTALTTVFVFFSLPETLNANILLRRAQRLRRRTGNPAYRSQAELDTPVANLAVRIIRQTIDDFKLSCMDPVILFVNLHTMLIYGVLYLWFEFFPFGESTGCCNRSRLQLTHRTQCLMESTTLMLFNKAVSINPRPL